ncbi:MAG: hypothetical protein M3Z21_02255 [Pseudomonadota bacterium]|nr:hypothetical protein [Pseudomonadota bacterium]
MPVHNGGLGEWLRGWIPKARDDSPKAEEVKALSEQFYITLRAQFCQSRQAGAQASQGPAQHIGQIFDQRAQDRTWSWNSAYQVEQLLVLLFDQETLQTELGRRLEEGRTVLRPELAAWYQTELAEAGTAAQQRALLLRLINDLQWRYTVNEVRRGYTRQITERTGYLFFFAIALFAFALVGPNFNPFQAWLEHDAHLLLLVTGAGIWGAAFSMLTGLKARMQTSSFNQLKVSRFWSMLVSRMLVGMGAALILYFFLKAGLLSGEMFPRKEDFHDVHGENGSVPQAKLIVWSFLAGFSERLVPGVLSRFEAQQEQRQEPRAVAPMLDLKKGGGAAKAKAEPPAAPAEGDAKNP